MEKITIEEVLDLLGINYNNSKSNDDIPCPQCDSGDGRKKHLNVNFQFQCWRCNKCDSSGGVFDFYSFATGCAREDVKNELIPRLRSDASVRCSPVVSKPQKTYEACTPIADIDVRDKAYRAFLKALNVNKNHLDNLHKRGLMDIKIIHYGFKSAPTDGAEAICAELVSSGIDLTGVPGFYKDKTTGNWRFVSKANGILIPVLDETGKVQGLQQRMDVVTTAKFVWISSRDYPEGTPSQTFVHFTRKPKKGDTVYITEGPMKGDIIDSYTRSPVLCVPGVSALKHLGSALDYIKSVGITSVQLAFDMDFLWNPHVTAGYEKLIQLIQSKGLSYNRVLWDSDFKGLDDFLTYQFRQNTRKGK